MDESPFDDLVLALDRLDRMLGPAVERMALTHGPAVAADPFRGLYISAEDADRLLAGDPRFDTADGVGGSGLRQVLGPASRLGRLADRFGLDAFDLDVLVIALAPELELRYERLYAYLHDDVSRRRPTVELALRLLCPSLAQRLGERVRFAPDAPLLRHGLLAVRPDPAHAHPSLPGLVLVPDDAVVRHLLDDPALDPCLAGICRIESPPPCSDTTGTLSMDATGTQRLLLRGRDVGAKRALACDLARHHGGELLHVDLDAALDADPAFEQVVPAALRAALLRGALPCLEPWDAVADAAGRRLGALLARHPGPVVLSGVGEAPRLDPAQVVLDVPAPLADQRRDRWSRELTAAGTSISDADLDRLAGRFRLTSGQIADAVAGATRTLRWRGVTGGADTLPEALSDAARGQSDATLGGLARKVRPSRRRGELVLPADVGSQMDEICRRVDHRHRVIEEWGFGRRLGHGLGVSALFAGPSGTGKTTCAEIVACELGLDLFTIDLSGIVSKYIGETEKNLARVFAAAREADAVLFFDEADALFGRRSEVRDSHDRYANIEVAFLLQQIEAYEGVAILATNLQQNLDEAFLRRIGFLVTFPMPDEHERAEIWRVLLDGGAPVSPDVDVVELGTRFPLSGGNIKNIVLAAAYAAAAERTAIGRGHLEDGARREYAKLGRTVPE